MAPKKEEEQDRTILADRWATAVAELDEAREVLRIAEQTEREAWSALKSSRLSSVPSDDE